MWVTRVRGLYTPFFWRDVLCFLGDLRAKRDIPAIFDSLLLGNAWELQDYMGQKFENFQRIELYLNQIEYFIEILLYDFPYIWNPIPDNGSGSFCTGDFTP